MYLDLQSWLGVISTAAIVLALIFTGVQVRAANRARMDQAAVTLLQSTQGDTWTRAMHTLGQLPTGTSAEQLEAAGQRAVDAAVDFGVRLETIGYMVFSRMIPLEKVDDLIGGVILMFWSRASAWVFRERTRTGNPRLLEWCEWLADRVNERRVTLGHEPAHEKHRGWA